MKVPLLDLTAQYKAIEKEVKAAMDGVLSSQKGILGPDVSELEKEVAVYCHSRHAVAVASGTDALLLSLVALGVGTQSGVITVPFTFFATVGSIHRLGATPLFVDINPETYNMDPRKLTRFLEAECRREKKGLIHKKTGKTVTTILPVHLYGQNADMEAIQQTAKTEGLTIVEDACQSIGATFQGQDAGTFGEFGALSFFPSKNLGGLGDGGMVLTQDEKKADLMRVLRVHGSAPKYFHKVVGINSRLDTLQACLLRVKLPHLGKWTKARQEHALFYNEHFSSIKEIVVPKIDCRNTHVFNQYCIRVPKRDALQAHLKEKGIGTEIYYPLPLHLQECFRPLGYEEGAFPQSEKAAKEVLALPVYPELKDDQLTHVAEAVRSFFG